MYTSTYNVVFGGQEIVEGREEDLPYFPLDQVSLQPSLRPSSQLYTVWRFAM